MILGHMDMKSIFRKGQVDLGVELELTVVFGPSALLQGGALEVDHHSPWGAVQELALTLVGPRVDQSVQGERSITIRKDEVQGKLFPLLCVPSLAAMEEAPSKEGTA